MHDPLCGYELKVTNFESMQLPQHMLNKPENQRNLLLPLSLYTFLTDLSSTLYMWIQCIWT